MALRTMQPSFVAGELSPALFARVDLAKYSAGLKTAKNVFIHPHGGASNRPGLEWVATVKDSSRITVLIPFAFNTEQTYVLEFGNLYMRVHKDGATVLSGGAPYEIATPYPEADLRDIRFVQDADIMYLTHVSHPIKKLSRTGHAAWAINDVTFGPTITAPTGVAAAANQVNTSFTYQYKVSAISAASGEESLATISNTVSNDLTISGHSNTITWDAHPDAARYVIYKYDSGVWGYIGGTEGTTFDDENITADLSDTPQTDRNPFVGAGNYPRVATFFEQRLAFASTLNDPQAVWLSQSANYENFGFSSPAKASDAITVRLKARQVNEIRAMIPGKGLILLTSDTEWSVTGGQDDYLSPTNPVVRTQGYRGASKVAPLLIGNVMMFAQARGGVVRDFSYQFAEDGYVGSDLTVLARHLFEGREITAWTYAQSPYSIVWAILDNEDLISLTYLREHEVWAWTRHETNGAVESITSIAEGDEDAVYVVVKRTVAGVEKRFIERLHSRMFTEVEDAFFVDSGRSYDGAASGTFLGMDHLIGETVVALADGNVYRGLTVVGDGSVTLPNGNTASKIHIGLPYEADIETLAIDLGAINGLGTVQGRQKSISGVTFRVEKTRGIFVGPDEARLVEYKQRATEPWGAPIELFTGDIAISITADWDPEGNVFVRQSDPLPMTILAIMPDVHLGK